MERGLCFPKPPNTPSERACGWAAIRDRLGPFSASPTKFTFRPAISQKCSSSSVARRSCGPSPVPAVVLLTRNPDRICLLDVIQAVDPLPRIRAYSLELGEHERGLGPLLARLNATLAEIEQSLRGCTLAKLLGEPVQQASNEGSRE